MYIISLVANGSLEKTTVKPHPTEAAKVAKGWYETQNQEEPVPSTITIDMVSESDSTSIRCATINSFSDPAQVEMNLNEKVNVNGFTHYSHAEIKEKNEKTKRIKLLKQFLLSFLEYVLIQLTKLLKEKNERSYRI